MHILLLSNEKAILHVPDALLYLTFIITHCKLVNLHFTWLWHIHYKLPSAIMMWLYISQHFIFFCYFNTVFSHGVLGKVGVRKLPW